MKFKLVEAVSDFNKMKKALSTYEGRLPFRYDSEYGDYIDELYGKAINKLEKKFSNVFIEPSIQLGSGSLFATFNYKGEECTAEWDYQEESEEIDDLIVNSKSEAEFIRKLAKYIETMLLYDYAEDSDSSDPGSSDIAIISASYAAKYRNNKHIKIEEGITAIESDCFKSFKQLESIDLPNTLKRIGDNAFYDCDSLESVVIPDSVTSIGERAFSKCKSLKSIVIPASIGYCAFSFCSSLESVIINEGVTSIGEGAFWSCERLTSITIPKSVTSIGGHAFRYCKGLTSITIPDNVTSIDDYAFYDCTSLTSITIPNSVTSIGNGAFLDCDSLTSITIPDNVTYIGDHAFSDCSGLTSINIPDGVTYIGFGAFNGCTSLKSIIIPDSVTHFGPHLFGGCTSLRDVIIGEGITEFQGFAHFKSCSNLKAIMIPDSVTIMDDKMFEDCPDVIIYCNPHSYAHKYAKKHNLATRFYADVVKDAESRISESFFDKSLNNAPYADGVKVSTNRMDKVKFPRVDTVRPITETADNKPVIPAPYDKYFEVIESEPYYYAKECSYDIAREIAQLAKRALKLPAHEVEMLEHDINNLRSNEWVEQFTQLSNKSRAKELFFKYAVEPEGYVPGDKVSGATILAEVAPKDAYVEIFDSMYNLVDDPQFPVVEIVHDRLYPVEIPGKMNENFSKEFESHELLDTGELISALKALVKEYGHMELEKEIYLETVENEHGRQLKIGHSSI